MRKTPKERERGRGEFHNRTGDKCQTTEREGERAREEREREREETAFKGNGWRR